VKANYIIIPLVHTTSLGRDQHLLQIIQPYNTISYALLTAKGVPATVPVSESSLEIVAEI
jgi:hypothetical protein